MLIFHSYVSLPEGNDFGGPTKLIINHGILGNIGSYLRPTTNLAKLHLPRNDISLVAHPTNVGYIR